MNIALIFAGGKGNRFYNSPPPKQFLECKGKSVLAYTIEAFQQHPAIDAIVVVCLESWIPYLQQQLETFHLSKVAAVVPGGETGQDSIFKGLEWAVQHYDEDSLVLLHDGVRPLVSQQTISDCLQMIREKGNCVVCSPATETMIVAQADGSYQVPDRRQALLARAPQGGVLFFLTELHRQARLDGRHDFVDTCSMMRHYGHDIYPLLGSVENIKITTPSDFLLFRAIIEEQGVGVRQHWQTL